MALHGLPNPRRLLVLFGPSQMVLAVVFVLLVFFIFSTIRTAAQSYELRQQHSELLYDINHLQTKKNILQGLDNYLVTDEYIEAYAREYYGLTYPGETSVRINAIEPLTNNRDIGEAWWEPIFSQLS